MNPPNAAAETACFMKDLAAEKARPIAGTEFSREEIDEALRTNGLLSVELEMTRLCNLRCTYCYSEAGRPIPDEFSFEELTGAVRQARALGAKKVAILGGGEPCCYPQLRELIACIRDEGMYAELFTNGTLVTGELAAFFYRHEVTVVVKRNSDVAAVQDALAGVEGTFNRIEQGMAALMDAGYPDETHGLGIQTIVCRQNLHRLADLWVWARERNIHPYFECMTLQGRATEHNELYVSPEEARDVFFELSRIDRERYGRYWTPHPPLAGSSCRRHAYSAFIKANGDVCPCVGVEISLGNLRETALADILRDHPVAQELRHAHARVKGACRTCELGDECYGCRGNAFQMSGDYLGCDPYCWISSAAPDAGRE